MEQKGIVDRIKDLKADVLRMFYHSGTGHLASAFSCIEILTAVYCCKDECDSVILSKGHGAAALYAILADEGLIEHEELGTYYDMNSRLLALSSPTLPGISIPTGSLGQGICYATGIAKAKMLDGEKGCIFCIIGDGEMQEGSVWEAAIFAAAQKLGNMIVILDYNHIQAGHSIDIISDDNDIDRRWGSFHWNVIKTDGHDGKELLRIFRGLKRDAALNEKPTIVIAETIKGNGIPGIQGEDDCHMKNPKGDQWESICRLFGISKEGLEKL